MIHGNKCKVKDCENSMCLNCSNIIDERFNDHKGFCDLYTGDWHVHNEACYCPRHGCSVCQKIKK